MGLWIAVVAALAFSATNGIQDAANAIATLVATRGARPAQALAVAATFNMLGAVVVSTAVAGTIAGIVTVAPRDAVAVIGAGLAGATAWNALAWSRTLPSSSGHALVGGLVGSGLADAGLHSVRWGGLAGMRPVGVLGVLIALAVTPVLGLAFGLGVSRLAQVVLRRATHAVDAPIRAAEWVMSAALSFSHGANDAQKSMGAISAMLLATGHLQAFSVPFWVKLACGGVLTVGTALGGWRIVRKVGRGIIRLAPIDGLSSQTASTAVILAASYFGAPVSTTHVVSSSIVGVGGGQRRWRHVRWTVVRSMGLAWILTLPGAAILAAVTLAVWKGVA